MFGSHSENHIRLQENILEIAKIFFYFYLYIKIAVKWSVDKCSEVCLGEG